ncbi:MAG: hypothetical protein RML95_14895 [Anaerolineae bacterium]|nr:hypothetical protein [Anaerolineae bacterium]
MQGAELRARNALCRKVNHDSNEAIAWRLDAWLGSRAVRTLAVAERGAQWLRFTDTANADWLRHFAFGMRSE